MTKLTSNINKYWTDIYYHLHYAHDEKITHQAVRILQHVNKTSNVGIREIATYLNISHNTASEHIKRLINKEYLLKQRDPADERKVILRLTESGNDVLFRNTSLDEEKLSTILEQLNEEERQVIEHVFKLLSDGAKKCM